MTPFDVEAVRRRFSSLGTGFCFFDAPGGSQVPDEVGQAIANTLRDASANLGAPYPTGQRVERIVDEAKARGARFLNCSPAEVVFGMNMTTLNFALTRVLGRELRERDEILVTRLDHDGNVAPWVELAEDLGLVVQHVEHQRRHDARPRRPRVEAVGAHAGRLVPVGLERDRHARRRAARRASSPTASARSPGSTPSTTPPTSRSTCRRSTPTSCSARPTSSAGPHLGMAYVRESLAQSWRPYKARPSASTPDRPPLRDRHAALRAARPG